MNDLVKFSGGVPANPEDLIAGLQNVSSNIQSNSGGVPFLRLLKSGVFVYGPENIEPEQDSEWAANPNSLQHGWACWGDGELLGEQMAPFNQAPPPKGGLPDYGQDWSQQVSINLQCLNGEDEGVSVLYKGTSTGLRNAVKELINALIAQLQTDPNHCVPVLSLEADSYQHKKHGQIFFPVLEIVRWIGFDGDGETTAAIEDQPNTPDPDTSEDAQTNDSESASDTQSPETAQQPPRRRRRAAASSTDTGKGDEKGEGKSTRGSRRRRRS